MLNNCATSKPMSDSLSCVNTAAKLGIKVVSLHDIFSCTTIKLLNSSNREDEENKKLYLRQWIDNIDCLM